MIYYYTSFTSIHISNFMSLGELGARHRFEAIKRALLYHSKIIKHDYSSTKDTLEFESRNNISQN